MARTIVLDTESTGFSPTSGDRLVELAAIVVDGNGPTGEAFHGVFWPEREVPAMAAKVHGWTTQRLRGKPLFSSVAFDLAAFLEGSTIWAHNATFDQKFLNAEMERAGMGAGYKLSCSLKLAKRRLPHLPAHKLANLTDWAGHRWTGQAHTAMADTQALAAVLAKLWMLDDPVPTPKTATSKKATSRAVRAPSALPVWDGPMAPGHDPRVARIQATDPLYAQGHSWTDAEDLRLRAAFLDGANLAELVRDHGRSPAALALRLERQGLVAGDHPYAYRQRRG